MDISRRGFVGLGALALGSALFGGALVPPQTAMAAASKVSSFSNITDEQSVWLSNMSNVSRSDITIRNSEISFLPNGTMLRWASPDDKVGDTVDWALGIPVGNVTKGKQLYDADGLVLVRFRNAGKLDDGSKVDIVMKITRLNFPQGRTTWESEPTYYAFLKQYSEYGRVWYNAVSATQVVATFTVVKAGTDTKVSIPDGYWFKYDDIDVAGSVDGTPQVDSARSWNEYAEGVKLETNYGQTYLTNDTWLVEGTDGGKPTFIGSRYGDGASTNKLSLVVKAKQDYHVTWRGGAAATRINAIFNSKPEPVIEYGGIKLQKSDAAP